jgi:hypothetical protein
MTLERRGAFGFNVRFVAMGLVELKTKRVKGKSSEAKEVWTDKKDIREFEW